MRKGISEDKGTETKAIEEKGNETQEKKASDDKGNEAQEKKASQVRTRALR